MGNKESLNDKDQKGGQWTGSNAKLHKRSKSDPSGCAWNGHGVVTEFTRKEKGKKPV